LTRRFSPIALCVVVSLSISTAASFGHPAGKTTVQETVVTGAGDFKPLVAGKGEKYKVLTGFGADAHKGRKRTRRSMVFFGQLTDPQLADEMSPLRLEALDPGGPPEGGRFSSAWRPQEAMGAQLWDQVVRNMNLNRKSDVRQGNRKRARMRFVLATGDLADNQQTNETEWYVQVMDGGLVDPFSGKPISDSNPCDQADAAETAQLNAAVANRLYTGVQDYSDWPSTAAPEKQDGYWDPDEAPPTAASPYAAFPRYPGLLDRAQQPFMAQGLKMPWYAIRGNHDGLIGGTFAATGIFRFLGTSCLKVYPNKDLDEDRYASDGAGECTLCEDLSDPAFVQAQLDNAGLTPPDPERALVTPADYKRLHGTADNSHGWGWVDDDELDASSGAASYYAFTRRGIRFIGLDTVADGGSAAGNIDNPQYKWLKSELKRAQNKGQLIIPFGHHTLESMTATVPDEDAEECGDTPVAGCDLDPRASTPIHLGTTGRKNIRKLFLRYSNVIAYVNGHTHENAVTGYKRKGHGFWSINTSSITDTPQQSRLIEVMNNKDGTLSIFATLIEHAAPLDTPAEGPANVFTETQLGSIARRLAANDPHGFSRDENGNLRDPRGDRKDRNVELLIDDPRLPG
jgi:metallophosphoesterase (TIGR03767 family)